MEHKKKGCGTLAAMARTARSMLAARLARSPPHPARRSPAVGVAASARPRASSRVGTDANPSRCMPTFRLPGGQGREMRTRARGGNGERQEEGGGGALASKHSQRRNRSRFRSRNQAIRLASENYLESILYYRAGIKSGSHEAS